MHHNILVTGANGQLGRELCRVCAAGQNNYVFTDVDELDITDKDAVMRYVRQMGADVIVNCAAYTNVDKAEDDDIMADRINHQAVSYLAMAARDMGATLVHISTDYVFNGHHNRPYKEDDPTEPLGVYGKTKLAGEQAVVLSGCRYVIFRTSWLYSAFGNNFVKTMKRLTAERDSLQVVFDQVGTPTYAGDLAAMIFGVIEHDQLDRQGVYHFSNEGVCSWYDFAVEICRQSGNVCDIKPCHSYEYPSKVNRPPYSVLDKTKVKETFGLQIPYWRDSLRRCISDMA